MNRRIPLAIRKPALHAVLLWGVVSACVFAADYTIGRRIQFPVLYLLPVLIVAHRVGLGAALAMSVPMPVVHLWFTDPSGRTWLQGDILVSLAVRIVVFGLIASLVNHRGRHLAEVHALLQQVMGKIDADARK